MNKRWILALTAAVGVGLLTVPLLMTRPPVVENVEAPSISAKSGPVCRTSALNTRNFTLKDINGVETHLSDYRGKVVLVNFWATWCGPCKVEIPEFVEAYSEYKDRGFVILGVLTNDTPAKEDLTTFLTENKMTYPVVYSTDEIETAFGSVMALPTSFLLGRDGSVCAQQLGPVSKADLARSLKALL